MILDTPTPEEIEYRADVRVLGDEPDRERWQALWDKWRGRVNVEALAVIGLERRWVRK